MRLALAAVALASAAALASACGGIEHEPNLANAVERTEEAGSSRIEARTNEGSDGGIADLCEGVADYARKRLGISCT